MECHLVEMMDAHLDVLMDFLLVGSLVGSLDKNLERNMGNVKDEKQVELRDN